MAIKQIKIHMEKALYVNLEKAFVKTVAVQRMK